MALLYPWATKEYLLWEMSLGQIIMYHNLGIELKYPKPDNGETETLADKARAGKTDELRELREKLREQYGEIG